MSCQAAGIGMSYCLFCFVGGFFFFACIVLYVQSFIHECENGFFYPGFFFLLNRLNKKKTDHITTKNKQNPYSAIFRSAVSASGSKSVTLSQRTPRRSRLLPPVLHLSVASASIASDMSMQRRERSSAPKNNVELFLERQRALTVKGSDTTILLVRAGTVPFAPTS